MVSNISSWPEADAEGGSKSQASRERLLMAALRCFAEHGYAKTSTRMIAEAAGANVAAIRYYFEDKAGIYRAAFTQPMGSPRDDMWIFTQPDLSLEQVLHHMYAGFIEPLKLGETARLCTKLHMREMIEPTGLWQEELNQGIKPFQLALRNVLCQHLGLEQADDDVQRLAFAIAAQGAFLLIAQDIYQAVCPQLISSPQALEMQHQRMTEYALTLVAAEEHRRTTLMKKKTP